MEAPDTQPQIPEKFLKPYSPHETEDKLYKLWEDSGFFNPDVCIEKGIISPHAEPFSIVLPPPNVTGTLHIGHAYEDTLQDAFVRFHRMRGKKTLWIPGTDSAAMATQSRVEKDIYKKEKKTRHDLGREEILTRVETFAKESEGNIIAQVKKMGSSLDWSRYAYTLDDKRYKAVLTAFKSMYDKGLIYRGSRIVNWDPKGQTTISDDEIVYEEREAILYTFRYWKDFPIAISTTRPETKVGDLAVAVHPDDERYQEFTGKEFTGEFAGTTLTIRIITDESVEKDFGTGALGVTPAHSQIDWEIADRHELPRLQVINEYAKMTEEAGPLVAGLKTTEAREKIVAWLRDNNLLEKEETVKQNVSTAERTGGIIEPLPKLQWFIDVNKEFEIEHSEIPGIMHGDTVTLKTLMKTVVESGAVQFPQERFRKIYLHWVNNLRDWCISRQIWYGHRIPVWYRGEEAYCGVEAPDGNDWEQDPDVLDTWFSSALWTFSTLGWPDETNDLSVYHPTSLMSPAYEILPLWVSRMILMSTFHLGQVPFRTVMIHGLVRDKQGRKFSKSLNNGIDPLDMIEKYGADALRMGLLVGTAIGNDISFDEDKIRGYKHFANKLWNISRFILTHTTDIDPKAALTTIDKEKIAALKQKTAEISEDIESFRLYLAAEKAYHFVWHELADVLLEESKPILLGDEVDQRRSRQVLLREYLIDSLKLLHPFMPYVTEAIWQELPGNIRGDEADMLIVASWPRKNT